MAADIPTSLSRLGPHLAYNMGSVFQLSSDSWGFTSRPTLSPGHDDPYSFKRSLFGGGDYHVPGDFLRTDVFRVGLAVRGFSSLPHPPSLELRFGFPPFMGMGFGTVLVRC